MILCLFTGCDTGKEQKDSALHDSLQVTFVGTKDDADCIIMQSFEKEEQTNIMIDTGEKQDGEHIIALLKQKGIKDLDLLLVTHPDKDHIGSLEEILSYVKVEEVIIPYYHEVNEKYLKLLKRVARVQNRVKVLTKNDDRQYGELIFSLYAHQKEQYKKDNDYSIAVLAEYGDKKFFFAGDAMKKRTKELIEEELPAVDVYKMAYHGREYKGFDLLFQRLNPAYTVVTAKRAEEKVEEVLKESGTTVLYTRNTDIVFETDGKQLRQVVE